VLIHAWDFSLSSVQGNENVLQSNVTEFDTTYLRTCNWRTSTLQPQQLHRQWELGTLVRRILEWTNTKSLVREFDERAPDSNGGPLNELDSLMRRVKNCTGVRRDGGISVPVHKSCPRQRM
jgi:hypothetical protein